MYHPSRATQGIGAGCKSNADCPQTPCATTCTWNGQCVPNDPLCGLPVSARPGYTPWQPGGFTRGTPVAKQSGFAPAATFYRGAPGRIQARRGLGAAITAQTPELKRLAARKQAARVRVARAMIAAGIRPGDPRSACKSTKSAAQHGCKGGSAFYNPGWGLWCCGPAR